MGWQGLTLRSLKHHYSLYPLYVATGVGAIAAALYIFRLATQNPDASWARKKNPHPWNKIPPNENIKFLSAGRIDHKSQKKQGPEI